MSDDNKQASPANKNEEALDEALKEWKSLDGRSRDRFKKVINVKNQALEEAENLKAQNQLLQSQLEKVQNFTQKQPEGEISTEGMTPDEKRAFNRLQQLGVATKTDVKELTEQIRQQLKEEMQAEKDRELLQREHSKLESKFSGDYPAYDPKEVEEHMKTKGIYDPETAYKDLYWDEIINLETKKKTKEEKPTTLQTKSNISASDPMSPQALSERLAQPDGRKYYLENKDKIEKMTREWAKKGMIK
jgi:hypothetical protein